METASDSWKADTGHFLRNASEPDRQRGDLDSWAAGRHPEPPGDIMALADSWERFSVLAVRIDGANRAPRALSTGTAAPDRHESLEAGLPAIDTVFEDARAAAQDAQWFRWQETLYGFALPGMETPAARQFAQELQTGFGRLRPESLTVGIAAFPLLDFSRAATFVNACKALEHAAFFGPGGLALFDSVSLNISGDHCYQQGDLQAAMAEYRDALRLDAANANVHNSLGVCLARGNDLAGAALSFQTALSFKADEAMAVYNLGVVQLIENDQAGALESFRKAWGLDSGKSFEIALALGKLLCEQAQWEQARAALDAALALRGDSAQAHTLLGQCLAALNLDSAALTAYTRAVKLNPNDAAALSALAELYAAKNENPDICLTFGRQSVALAPDNALFHFRLGRLYEKYNQLESALPEYEKAVALGYPAQAQAESLRCRPAADEPKKCCA